MKPASLNYDALGRVVRQLPDNGLAPAREAALARLGEHGLPTLRDEDWKYTDLAPMVDISNRWLDAGGHRGPTKFRKEAIDAITGSMDATWLLIVNGCVDGLSSGSQGIAGLEISRLGEVPSPSELSKPLTDLNVALLQDGIRIRVSRPLDKPIGLLFFDSPAADADVVQTYVDIDVANGANAEFIEYHGSDGDGDHYANSVVRMTLGDGATVNHVRIQNRAKQHVQTSRIDVLPGDNSRLHMAGYDLGGRLIRNDLAIDLGRPGADISFDGLYLAGDGQHIDNHTRVDHRVGPARSSQEYRGILNGNCRCVWNGKAIVHKGADGSDARQANHNLLMSERAEVDAKPELEIYADDVKCSHGTTVGQLDETALFYLRSRGLDKQHATRVLTHAFASEVVRRAPVASAIDAIAAVVEARLAELIKDDAVAELLS